MNSYFDFLIQFLLCDTDSVKGEPTNSSTRNRPGFHRQKRTEKRTQTLRFYMILGQNLRFSSNALLRTTASCVHASYVSGQTWCMNASHRRIACLLKWTRGTAFYGCAVSRWGVIATSVSGTAAESLRKDAIREVGVRRSSKPSSCVFSCKGSTFSQI